MTVVPPVHIAPMAQVPDVSAKYNRGCMTSGVRIAGDHRTHVDRISPYLAGESYAGAGGAAMAPAYFSRHLVGTPPLPPVVWVASEVAPEPSEALAVDEPVAEVPPNPAVAE